MPSGVRAYLRRFGSKKTFGGDLRAGLTLGIESVPDGLAAGVLAGVNPVMGLNGYLMGTLAGSLATGSVFMMVQSTGAMGVLVADVPEVHGDGAAGAMAMLAVLAGVVMLGLGLARMGRLVRFIPTAVLYGFVNAVAVNIVLGQLDNFTGYDSQGANRITRLIDTLFGLPHFLWWSVLVGLVTLGLILVLERTRLGALALVVAVAAGSAFAALLPHGGVATLADIADVSGAHPTLTMPDVGTVGALVLPAVSLALVGLVQGAAISGSIPNPDGRYPDASADFTGQGVANVAVGLFGGMPAGGSMSATAIARTAGARTALTGVIAAAVMLVTALLLGRLIEFVAMPALAALLILVGVRTFDYHQAVLVWRTGPTQAAVFCVTFVLSILIPLQYAVLAGVGLAIVLQIAQQSNRVRLVRWTFDDPHGRPVESEPPEVLVAGDTVVIAPYGSLFFASTESFRAQLPSPGASAPGGAVVIRLRGTEELGVTFLTMLRRYAGELRGAGATLMLTGVNERVSGQLRATGIIDAIGSDNVFAMRPRLGDALESALAELARRRDASGRTDR
ncbi:SulP family inorganic anion transporter [Microbacterium halophytorum]|uniref:SulP family inorganic anion transporter n=1 Tax=Microbacterium halophytorum TaxID=2067568 RepID=UPI000CFBA154|nr:SulP family inorganic anion transporter [Microbacterium halophytorum]